MQPSCLAPLVTGRSVAGDVAGVDLGGTPPRSSASSATSAVSTGSVAPRSAHCVTSPHPGHAAAQDLGQLLRDHWAAIGNKLHWVRDTTFNEDASTLRAGTAPQTMAIIRNTLIVAFRLTGWNNLKQAHRHFSHVISRCVNLITKPVKTVKHQT